MELNKGRVARPGQTEETRTVAILTQDQTEWNSERTQVQETRKKTSNDDDDDDDDNGQ